MLLPRKPKKIIVEFIGKTWGVEKSRAYDYIRLAEKEWGKYFSQVKRCGKAYYFSKFRHLYDKALSDNDTRLALDVTDKEIKLAGLYVEKKEVGEPGSFAEWVKAVKEEKKRRRNKKRRRLRIGK